MWTLHKSDTIKTNITTNMNTNIHLYIGDTEVEFAEKPEILYTYQMDELTNPTVVKNSFSKTITVKGTKSNNHLFGHYWNVERLQLGGDDNVSNIYFNASKKMNFQLFVDTELYESGYVKLDEIRRIGKDYEYDITLYGGLGDFFYNLSINDDGNQKKLSDLNFNEDIDFTINLNTVKEAWKSLKDNNEDKWQLINFMPAYNGLPEDFDNKKMVIDTSSTNLKKQKTEDNKTYTTKNGWTLAELPEEMSEWETRDLRSYNQRPCIRMKEIINACCQPENNGGYEVQLDEDFFNQDNAYWQNTWLSLPMIQNLEYDNAEQIIDNATLMTATTEGNTEGYMYQPLTFDMGEFPSTVVSSINATVSINCDIGGDVYTSYKWFWNVGGDSYHTNWACYGSLFCQLLAFNGDTVVGASKAYNLTTPIRHDGKLWYGDNSNYSGGHSFTPYLNKPIVNLLGYFHNGYFTKENKTDKSFILFTIDGLTTNVTDLKMCYYWGASKDKLKQAGQAYSLFSKSKEVSWAEQEVGIGKRSDAQYMTMTLHNHNLKAVLGAKVGRTGTEVTKNLILATESSPCDYLLSYCKMFGLYFSKSPHEKKINIQTRKSFYDRDNITDISNDIDYSKNVTITPISFGSKWVEFNQEQDETQYSKDYQTVKGITYGCKVLNTGYEFDSEKVQLLENNVIKSGVEGLEKSKYFTCYNNDDKVRPFFGYGMKYQLYNGNDSIEISGSNSLGSNLLGINEDSNLKYYDLFPKVQFHDKSNKPTDGNNCLVFFSGFKNLTSERANPVTYILTDDSYYQTQLNESTPCWLFVSGNKDLNGKPIARTLDEIPVFERYLTDSNGTTVKKSLDFGTAQELYIPKYGITEDVNIYSNFWKTYLEDLYNVNTKILTVYVRLKDKVGYNLLKQFYWFENAIWRINKITDWNIGLEGTTKVEYVKVQDLNNYTSITQKKKNVIKITASKYNVDSNGETININLTTNNGGDWRLTTNNNNLILSSNKGTGNSTIQLTIPQTNTPSTPLYYTITAIDNEGNTSTINIRQSYSNETQFSVTPNSLIVPYNGGNYDVQFEWTNQGNNEITEYSVMGDINANVTINGYNASISVTENKDINSVIGGEVLFINDLYSGKVGIEQIPQQLTFGKEGGEYEFTFNYNKEVSYDNLPSWAIMKDNKITVLENYYEIGRTATIKIYNKDSFAYMELNQKAGKPQNENLVTPTILIFGKDGGLQYLNIQIPNTWVLTKVGDWFTTNISNGYGASIVGVECGANGGNTRNGTITITDLVTGKEYNVIVRQSGETTGRELFVTPTKIETDYNGGEFDVTVIFDNRNGDNVTIDAKEWLTWTDLIWVGDIATTKVKVPVSNYGETKTYVLTFKSSIGNVDVEVIQSGVEPRLTISKDKLFFTSSGGTESINITSNVRWDIETEDEWVSVKPLNGSYGTTSVTIEVEENNTSSDRYGYIYVRDVNTGNFKQIIVYQEKFVETLTISPSSIVFDAEGGTATVTITSNTDWIIELN